MSPPDRFRTADDVLDALAGLRKQQAEQDDLAKQVNDLKALLRKKLDGLEKRMKELKAAEDTPPPAPVCSY